MNWVLKSASGQPIADIKGKLVPMVRPIANNEARVRINLGASTLAYPAPSLPAEVLSNTWTASTAWWSACTIAIPKSCV